MSSNLASQIINLLNQSDQPLSILEEVIVQLTEGKFNKLKEIERLVSKQNSKALFKERIVELKAKYPDGKQSKSKLAELEFLQYKSPHYKRDNEEIEEERNGVALIS